MDVDTMVEIIRRKWTLSGYGTNIDPATVKSYLIDSVYQVEGIDCPTSTSFTVSNGELNFNNGDPSNDISMLYIYCTLAQLQDSYLHGLLDDGELGITVKSNMESVSSTAASKLHSGMKDNFDKKYKEMIEKYKISKLNNASMIKIYPNSDYN